MACFYDSGGVSSSTPETSLDSDDNDVAAAGAANDSDDDICIVYERIDRTLLQEVPSECITLSSPGSQSENDEKMDKANDPDDQSNSDEEKNCPQDGSVKPSKEEGEKKEKESKSQEQPEETSGKTSGIKVKQSKNHGILPLPDSTERDQELGIPQPKHLKRQVINTEEIKKTISEVNFLRQKHKNMMKSSKSTKGLEMTKTAKALGSSHKKRASTVNKITDMSQENKISKKRKANDSHLLVAAQKLTALEFPDCTLHKKRRNSFGSDRTARKSSESSSLNATCLSTSNQVLRDCTAADGVVMFIHCVLTHLRKLSTDYESTAEKLLCSLHLLLESTGVPADISKENKEAHTDEQPGSCYKEGSSNKQYLLAYFHSLLKDYSHPEESQKKRDFSVSQCIINVFCFKRALEWLCENTQSNLESELFMNLKNTANALEILIKHLNSLQKQDEKDDNFCSTNDTVHLDFDASLLVTRYSELSASLKRTADHSQMANISVVSASSVPDHRSFLAKLYISWNYQYRNSTGSEIVTSSNQSSAVPNNDNNEFAADVTDHPSVEPKTPKSFCSPNMLSTEDYNRVVSNNADSTSSDETDQLVISESMVSPKESANHSHILNIKNSKMAATSDDANKCLAKETNHPKSKPPSSECSIPDITKYAESNAGCLEANAALSQKEGVKHADLELTSSNTETDEAQMTSEQTSISSFANDAENNIASEEITSSNNSLLLLEHLCQNQSSKTGQYEDPEKSKWKVFRPFSKNTRKNTGKKASAPLKLKFKKVSDTISPVRRGRPPSATRRSSRKRTPKSSEVKEGSQKSNVCNSASETTGNEPSILSSVQQAPLMKHLWKKLNVMTFPNTLDCDEAQKLSDPIDQDKSNHQPSSNAMETSTNNDCEEEIETQEPNVVCNNTAQITELCSPLNLSSKQGSVRSSVLDGSSEKNETIPDAIARNQNENQTESNSFSVFTSQIRKSPQFSGGSTLMSVKYNSCLPSFHSLTAASSCRETNISNNQCEQPSLLGQNVALTGHQLPLESTVVVPEPINEHNTNMSYEDTDPQITSVAKETDVSNNQCELPSVLGQNVALTEHRPLSENSTVLPQAINGHNTSMLSEDTAPQITSAENQVPSQQINSPSEGRALQTPTEMNPISSVNQLYLLQPALLQQRVPLSTNGTDDQRSNLRLTNENPFLQCCNNRQQFNLQQRVSVPRSDEAVSFDGVYAVPNNMNIPSQSDIQGMSHSGRFIHPNIFADTYDGRQNPNSELTEQMPGNEMASNEAQMPRSIAQMLDNVMASRNGPHMLGNIAHPLYKGQNHEMHASRAPSMTSPLGAVQTPQNIGHMFDGMSASQKVPGNVAHPSYNRQRHEMHEVGQTPHNIGHILDNLMAQKNSTNIPGIEVVPSYGRQRHEVHVSRSPQEGQMPRSIGQMLDSVMAPANSTHMPGIEVVPSYGRQRHEVHVSRSPQEGQMPRSIGQMLDNVMAPANSTHMPGNVVIPYGRQSHEMYASRALQVGQTPQNIGQMLDNVMAPANSTHMPGNVVIPYGRQSHEMYASRAPQVGQTPQNIGQMLDNVMAPANGTHMSGNEAAPSYGRHTQEMGVSSDKQAPGNMEGRQVPNCTAGTESQMPKDIRSFRGNPRQRKPPVRRKVKGRSNVGDMPDEVTGTQSVTVPNTEHTPDKINVNPISISESYRNAFQSQFPVQQHSGIFAERPIPHVPFHNDGSGRGQIQALPVPVPVPTGQIFPYNMPYLNQPYWCQIGPVLPAAAWNHQGQILFVPPSAPTDFHTNQSNQSSGNSGGETK